MRLSRIVLSATLFAALGGFISQAAAQTCLAVSVRGAQFSCPGCLSPGAMPLQCSVHQCNSPAPAVDGWVMFSAGFSDFASAGATCAGLGAAAWAGFGAAPPPAPPPVLPVVTPVTPLGPTVVPGPVITTAPVGPRVVIGSNPRTTKTTTVVVAKRKPGHVHTKKAQAQSKAKHPRRVVVVQKKKQVIR